MARGKHAVRLLQVLSFLNRNTNAGRGTTVAELVRSFSVTRRTLYRDLDHLQEAGFPLVGGAVGTWRGGIRLASPVKLPERKLDLADLVALHVAAQLAQQLGGAEHDQARDLFASVEATAVGALKSQLDRIVGALSVRGPEPRRSLGDGSVQDGVQRAVLERRALRIQYRKPRDEGAVWRTVLPYHHFYQFNTAYLLCFCEKSKALRTFAVNRMAKAELTDRRFEVPADFDAEATLSRSFGVFDEKPRKVRIHVDADRVFYATERRWHPSQRERTLPDGRVELTFHVGGLLELAGFVARWGGAMEVVEPAELRTMVCRMAARCAQVNGPRPANR